MKNFLILVMVILGITSCSKDSFELPTEVQDVPDKSEIMVGVTYLVWTGDQCEPGCAGTGQEEISFIANARINLYAGNDVPSDASILPVMDVRTNEEGRVLLENLDPGSYTVWVETELGVKHRTLTTQLGKRSFIDFSF